MNVWVNVLQNHVMQDKKTLDITWNEFSVQNA